MKCVYCGKEFEWKRSCAEEDKPRDCEECRKYSYFIETIIMDIKSKLFYHRDQKKAYEFAKSVKKRYKEFAKDEEVVHFSKFW